MLASVGEQLRVEKFNDNVSNMTPIIIPVARVRLVLACVHSDLRLTSAESASLVLDLQENLTLSLKQLKVKI